MYLLWIISQSEHQPYIFYNDKIIKELYIDKICPEYVFSWNHLHKVEPFSINVYPTVLVFVPFICYLTFVIVTINLEVFLGEKELDTTSFTTQKVTITLFSFEKSTTSFHTFPSLAHVDTDLSLGFCSILVGKRETLLRLKGKYLIPDVRGQQNQRM